MVHFAGTLAVKEAVIKAARLGPFSAWARRIEVQRDPSGAPRVQVAGEDRGRFEISISHDGLVAVAVAMAAGRLLRSAPGGRETAPAGMRPNLQLRRYLSVVALVEALTDPGSSTPGSVVAGGNQ